MPIIGMTDQSAAFPIVGTLRKGEAKTDNKPGKDLTYFRFVTDDEDAEAHFNQAYPSQDELRHINVLFPYKTAKENFDAWIEKWVAGGLVYRSDGETQVLWRTDQGGYSDESKPDPKPEIKADGKRADGSGQVGRMSVIIPELGRLTTVTVMTTSKNDIVNLSRQLSSYEALNGDLRGIPFVLMRRKHMISTPGADGKRVRREKWLLSIETQPHYTRLHLAAIQQQALPEEVNVIEAEGWHEVPDIVELPSDAISPFDDEPEAEETQPEPTFANMDDLLFQIHKDFGLSEKDAKAVLKDYGYKGFKPSTSADMYDAIRLNIQAEQEAASITGADAEQEPLFSIEDKINPDAVDEADM